MASPANVRPKAKRDVSLFKDKGYRDSFFETQLKTFLAMQIRALRGDQTQAEFGRRIGKPQNVVSRLENEHEHAVNLQTLLDIAKKLDIAVVARFVDYPTFLRLTADYSDSAMAPRGYIEVARIREGADKAPPLGPSLSDEPSDDAPALSPESPPSAETLSQSPLDTSELMTDGHRRDAGAGAGKTMEALGGIPLPV
jgi:transcriptional regulator with XRE-family HTH domain